MKSFDGILEELDIEFHGLWYFVGIHNESIVEDYGFSTINEAEAFINSLEQNGLDSAVREFEPFVFEQEDWDEYDRILNATLRAAKGVYRSCHNAGIRSYDDEPRVFERRDNFIIRRKPTLW